MGDDDCDERGRWRGPEGPGIGLCLGVLPLVSVYDIRCGVTGRDYGPAGAPAAYQVILGRTGGYLRRLNGVETFADATSALVTAPGDEIQVAHPVGTGDTYTVVQWDGDVEVRLPPGELRVGDAADLAHRALVAECRRGIDGFELADRIEGLMLALLPGSPDGPTAARPATRNAHRKLVGRAVATLLSDGYHLSLDGLAAEVSASAPHLSRVFREVTGEGLTAYRNRLRVRAVLDDLAEGATNLRTLAARYGFADQSHLNRVMRRHLGRAPSDLQQVVRAPALQPQADADRP
ncbi:MAG: helix-turn-helix transcriptional regulator [Streptomycetaceae bacterium]|nr:helix-turn-helix transcriptional regulator [Streptomycetaceae bacterium]